MLTDGFLEPVQDWNNYVMLGAPPAWRTEHFSSSDLIDLQRKLTRTFYLKPGYIFSCLSSIRTRSDASYWMSAGVSYLKWYLTGKT
jgi:hypothetical protein